MCGRLSDGSNIYELEHSMTEEYQQMLTRIVQTFNVLLKLSLDCMENCSSTFKENLYAIIAFIMIHNDKYQSFLLP